MALQPDDESKTGTLPDPELNPLLNPLLAANMGRWAEVYFTNPPEKRAQAVADLLRELERNPPPERHPAPVEEEENLPEAAESSSEDTLLRRSLEVSHPAVVCAACGHANSTAQRFCGMCGMPLTVNEAASSLPIEPELQRQNSWHDQAPAESEISEEFHKESSARYSRIPLPSFASLSEDGDSEDSDGLFQYESRPARRNYRLYIGLGLAIVLGLLVYKTWRGNASFWTLHNAPSAPQEANAPAPAPAAQNPLPAAAQPPAPQNSSSNAPVGQGVAAQQQQTPPKPSPQKADLSRSPRPAVEKANPASPVEQLSGAAELAIGQKYLNGAPGTARDPREASSWLWKAVAKKNPTATLLLSDLYLRGDGVPKSCDQARLLLDAAARKGNAAAGERLRNLPAFGCQ